MTTRREKREFTDQFKEHMVKLYNSGKPRSEIAREYDLTPSALNNWIRRITATGSAKESDNRSPESTFKIFKTEFFYGRNFDSMYQLRYELEQYVSWFNNVRIHGSLNYLTPTEFRKMTL